MEKYDSVSGLIFSIIAAFFFLAAFEGAARPAGAWSPASDSNGTFGSVAADPGAAFSETFSNPATNSTNATITPGSTNTPATATNTGAATSDLSKTWASLSQGAAATMAVNSSLVDVTYISFTVSQAVNNIRLTVAKLAAKPQDIAASPPGTIYEYINVTPENITDSQIASASITFKVSTAWMASNNIDNASVVLYRYSGGNWNALPTSPAGGSTSDYINYVATTPGFSSYAISARVLPPAVLQAPANPAQTAGNISNVQNNTSNNAPPKSGTSLFLALVIIAALAAAMLYKYYPGGKSQPAFYLEKIADYIRGLAGREKCPPKYSFEPAPVPGAAPEKPPVTQMYSFKPAPSPAKPPAGLSYKKPGEDNRSNGDEELEKYFLKKKKDYY